MNCRNVQAVLSAYHDNALADDLRSRVSDHLDQCLDCTKKLVGFEKLSAIVGSLSVSTPPTHICSQLEKQLDQQAASRPVKIDRERSLPVSRRLALAATILIAVGIGWFSYENWFVHGEHDQFAADFGYYLEEFRRDPDAAHQILLARYESRSLDADQAIQQVGYRPAVADGLPEEYTLESTHAMRMPCCTCVHSICKRNDGSTLAILEHDDDSCGDDHCCLVELDDQIVASWKRGTRHIILIGVRDVAEVDQMVAWMDEMKGSL